jgi:hypothetical protein
MRERRDNILRERRDNILRERRDNILRERRDKWPSGARTGQWSRRLPNLA